MRFTSAGNARPFLSLSAGTVCTPGVPGDAAIKPLVVGEGAAGTFLFTALAGFSLAGAACFAAGLTARDQFLVPTALALPKRKNRVRIGTLIYGSRRRNDLATATWARTAARGASLDIDYA